MTGVCRYVKLTAHEGQGDALAQLMLQVAESLSGFPGCELYVINRSPSEPDVVWVTELWLSQKAIDTSLQMLQSEDGKARGEQVMALLEGPPERIDLEPLGGVGHLAGGSGFTHLNLDQVEDLAPKFGYGHMGEARFATGALDAAGTGVSHQRVRPGVRQAFGHRHQHAEEIYVVLSGSGRVKVDDDVQELAPLDAIRVAPESARAFEAGPEGLEVLAVGARRPGDVEMLPDFWPS
jgi:quinol monooxygenase YgiN/mannose-6-phosphate isomerase-like protein (cupin superfamily)